MAYIDATYDDGTFSDRIARGKLCGDINQPSPVCDFEGDVSGNDLQRTSKWQWNVGAAYETAFTDTLNAFGRVDVAGQSKQFVSELNLTTIEPRTLVNARFGVRGDSWTLAVWAKNLMNERYVSNAFFIGSPFQVDYVPTLGSKRRVGATLSFDY